MNDKPFSHTSRYGTRFESTRCDLREGIKVTPAEPLIGVTIPCDGRISEGERVVSDLAQMVAYHAMHIHPQLDLRAGGFVGYDCIRWFAVDKE
jgi:hypothetical protein